MRFFYSVLVFLLVSTVGKVSAQAVLSGSVTDIAGKPLKGVSVYLDGTLDGGTTDSAGMFSITTTEYGSQTLVASFAGYENAGRPLQLDATSKIAGIAFRVKKSFTALDEVVITAGAFETGNSSKTILKPLDILTTAGANADVIKAIQTLPGTQQQGNQTGLFVRGGDASEAAVIVDGLTVQNAFFSAAPGVSARSRFTPFQFKGVAFSSGGYSARYGQALSSILELNTLDLPEKSTLNLGANMAGVYASGAKLWDTTRAVEGTAYYNNLQPFYKLANTNFDFYDVPKGGGGSVKAAWKPRKGALLKVMGNYAQFSSGTQVPDPESPGQYVRFGIHNYNGYGTVSYRQFIGSKWNLYGAALYSANKDEINQNGLPYTATDNRVQARFEATRYLRRSLSILAGAELNTFQYKREFFGFSPNFDETLIAGYSEGSWAPLHWLSVRPGVRYEHSSLLNASTVSPRLSAGFKAGRRGTISVAGGSFYQNPDPSYLIYGNTIYNRVPEPARALHAITNYQWMTDTRTLRIEAYYKKYDKLLRENPDSPYHANSFHKPAGPVASIGEGYAQGLELFWRDKKSIKNADYWISYSYIDTKRQYRDYTQMVQPDFIATHNLSVVTKYWIQKLETQIGATYSYASGRPYYNAAAGADFLADRTPDYHNLAITVNKLFSIRRKWFTVVYAGVDNLTNRKNIFGYRYRNSSDANPIPQYPALFRSYFVGINLSRTQFDKDEL